MDLGRWNFRHLGRFLGDVLDGEIAIESKNQDTDLVRDAFEVSEDTEALERSLTLLRPGASAEKILLAFAPFFEGGLALRIDEGHTRLTSLFLFGQAFTPPDAGGTPVDIGLPTIEAGRVYRSSIAPILSALNLSSFFRLDGALAFAFKPGAGETIFVLFDNRPHPWQVFAIENAYLSARDTFARLETSRSAAVGARGFFK